VFATSPPLAFTSLSTQKHYKMASAAMAHTDMNIKAINPAITAITVSGAYQ